MQRPFVDLFQKYRHCVFANELPRNNELISSAAIVSFNFAKIHVIAPRIVEISPPRTETRDARSFVTIDFITVESVRDYRPRRRCLFDPSNGRTFYYTSVVANFFGAFCIKKGGKIRAHGTGSREQGGKLRAKVSTRCIFADILFGVSTFR